MLGQFLANSSVLSSCVGLCGVAGLKRETQWKQGYRNLWRPDATRNNPAGCNS